MVIYIREAKQVSKLSNKDKKELVYINVKESIKEFTSKAGYENVLRFMIEQFDTIDDITNTQSVELFKLISCLEDALKSYERLKSDLQTV